MDCRLMTIACPPLIKSYYTNGKNNLITVTMIVACYDYWQIV